MQAPSIQQQQQQSHTLPTDGQDVVALLNRVNDMPRDDEDTILPTDHQEELMDFDASFITEQGTSMSSAQQAPAIVTDGQTPSFPSWTWADRA